MKIKQILPITILALAPSLSGAATYALQGELVGTSDGLTRGFLTGTNLVNGVLIHDSEQSYMNLSMVSHGMEWTFTPIHVDGFDLELFSPVTYEEEYYTETDGDDYYYRYQSEYTEIPFQSVDMPGAVYIPEPGGAPLTGTLSVSIDTLVLGGVYEEYISDFRDPDNPDIFEYTEYIPGDEYLFMTVNFVGDTNGLGDMSFEETYRVAMTQIDDIDMPQEVPVPGAVWLFASALGGLLLQRRR